MTTRVLNSSLVVWLVAAWFFAAAGRTEGALYDHRFPGTIYELNDGNGQRIGTSVDHWLFSVVGGATEVSIDALSWEAGDPNAAGEYPFIDKVGAGSPEPAFFDTWIYLFERGPGGGIGNLVAHNDDNPFQNYDDDVYGAGWRDGSISATDSYLRVSIPQGDYVLAVGAYELGESAARSGLNQTGSGGFWYPVTIDDPDGDGWGPLEGGFARGDYLLTLTSTCDNIRIIPEPTGLAVWGLIGLLGIAASQSRRWRRARRLGS